MDEIIEGVGFSEIIYSGTRDRIDDYINNKRIDFTILQYISKEEIDSYDMKHIKFNYKMSTLIEELVRYNSLSIYYTYDNIIFNKQLDYLINNLPENIINLRINSYNNSNNIIINKLPSGLKYLAINTKLSNPLSKINLPPKLETLIIEHEYNFDLDDLPENLKVLILKDNINCKLDNLPNGILIVKLLNSKLKNISLNNLPDSVEHITIFSTYNLKIEKLPNNLKKISFNNILNRTDIQYKYYDELKELCKGTNIIFTQFR